MSRPWVKWYFDDWRGDPRLRMCGLAARGLWADILSYMHEGEPYGHFTIDGRVPELPDVARLVGAQVKDVRLAYAELERHGVFSRDDKGIPFSRRMVRDREVSDLGRQCVEKRWRPNSPPNRVPTPEPITKKPEARSQIPNAAHSAGPVEIWEQVWNEGRAYLVANGQSEGDARKTLMRWRQNHDELAILRALKIAKQNAVELPIPYIESVLKQKAHANGNAKGQPGAIARLDAKIAAASAEQDRRIYIREA